MDIKSEVIKSELQDESLDIPDVFHHEISENEIELVNAIKSEVSSDIEELTNTSANEKNDEYSTSVLCKNEPDFSISSHYSKIDVEDIFNEDDKVDIFKLKQLISQDETSSNNIKHNIEPNVHRETSGTFAPNQSSDDNLVNQHKEKIKSKSVKSINKEQRTKKMCQFCNKLFIRKQSLDDHLLKQHKIEINSDAKDFITNKIHKCKICTYQTTRKYLLDRHFNTVHNKQGEKKHSCQFCKKVFVTKQALNDHILKHHIIKIKPDTKDFVCNKFHTCNICNYKTTIKTFLDKHIHNEHSTEKNSCQFCNKLFVTKQLLDNHLIKNHKKKTKTDMITSNIYTCNICSYETTIKYSLDRHLNSAHNEEKTKRFSCQLCNTLFVKKQSLHNHLLKQHPSDIKSDTIDVITSKIHKCKSCKYQTTNKSHLVKHVDSHHSERRTETNFCMFCSKSFVRKEALDDHMLKQHRNEIKGDAKDLISSKIHTCNKCCYQTTNKFNLDRHFNTVHCEQGT